MKVSQNQSVNSAYTRALNFVLFFAIKKIPGHKCGSTYTRKYTAIYLYNINDLKRFFHECLNSKDPTMPER